MSVTSLRVEAKVLARLAAPVVFGQVGLMALGVVDTLMVGHLGVAEELAGVALGNSWSWGLVVFALGASAGLDPALTQAHGARDGDAYDRAVAMGALLLAILCVPIVLGHLFTEVALGALGQPVEVLGLSGAYNRAIAWGVGPFIFFSLLRQGMQAREVMRPAVWAIALGNLVNVPANLFFIEGGFGWEGMGPVGVGWSTTIVRWTMFLAIAVTAGRERRGISRGLARTTDRLRRTWRLATTALPVAFQSSLEMWAFQLAAIIAGWFGAVSAAAHAVVLTLTGLAFMLPSGVGAAAAIRVGNLVGAGRPWRVTGWTAPAMGGAVMLTCGLAYAALPEALAALFVPRQPETMALITSLLPMVAMFAVFDGVQAVCFGVLRGAGDTRLPALANVFGYYVVGLPLCVLLARALDFGPSGIWYGLTVGLMVVAVILVARVRHVMSRGAFRVVA